MGCTPVSSILCDGGVTTCGFFKVAVTRGRTWSLARGWVVSCPVCFSCSFSENPASVSRLVPWLVPRLVSFLDSSCNLFCNSFFPIALPYFLFNCKESLLFSIMLLFCIVLLYFDSTDTPKAFCRLCFVPPSPSSCCTFRAISFCFSSGRGSAISPVSSSRYNTHSSWSALVAAT